MLLDVTEVCKVPGTLIILCWKCLKTAYFTTEFVIFKLTLQVNTSITDLDVMIQNTSKALSTTQLKQSTKHSSFVVTNSL